MTHLDKARAEQLAVLVHAIRADWGIPGIMTALGKVQTKPLHEVVIAAVLAACNPAAKTPEVIAMDGDHWRDVRASVRSDAARHPSSTPLNELCHVHNRPVGHDVDGISCHEPSLQQWRAQWAADQQADTNTAGIARAKAALEQARATGQDRPDNQTKEEA